MIKKLSQTTVQLRTELRNPFHQKLHDDGMDYRNNSPP